MSIKNISRTDDLVELRKLFETDGMFAQCGRLIQIQLVVDANAVLANLRWLVCKAKSPSARTKLLELIDCETIVGYAPTYLEDEVLKNIPKIAEEEGVEASLLFEQWKLFKSKLRFIECGGPESGSIDPKDVPYIKLHEVTGFPVLSEDHHIYQMGAKVIDIQVVALAHKYSREAVVEYKIKVGALVTFSVSATMIKAACDLIRSMRRSLERIPSSAWLIVVAGFILAISNNSVRVWFKEKIAMLPEASKNFAHCLVETLEPIYLEYQQSQGKANAAKASLLSELKT